MNLYGEQTDRKTAMTLKNKILKKHLIKAGDNTYIRFNQFIEILLIEEITGDILISNISDKTFRLIIYQHAFTPFLALNFYSIRLNVRAYTNVFEKNEEQLRNWLENTDNTITFIFINRRKEVIVKRVFPIELFSFNRIKDVCADQL